MNINTIGSEAAAFASSQVKAPPSQALPRNMESSVKMGTIKSVPVSEDKIAPPQEKQPLTAKEAEQITIDLNEYMNDQTNLRFSMYEKLNHQVVVEIKNKETDELIKQIPSEELLELRVKMEELTGILFDAKS